MCGIAGHIGLRGVAGFDANVLDALTRSAPSATIPGVQSRILRSRGLRSSTYPAQASSQ